jgi:muramoyltetrapeptide carboxypeptidase
MYNQHTRPELEMVMSTSRRHVLQTLGAVSLAAFIAPPAGAQHPVSLVKPRRLAPGATVGLINPAGPTFVRSDLRMVTEVLGALGLRWKFGDHVFDRHGFLAGTDDNRAADVNTMFRDPSVDAILAVRGGWGCNRILPLLDYDTIRKNPKIIVGYSDITSLLLAIYAKTGLVTFHGPVGTSTWNQFSTNYFKRVLFDAEAVTFENPETKGDNLIQTKDRVETISQGTARGTLVGGNLSVLTAMIGSPYLPQWKGTILFLEDDGEAVYRVDRMLTQLRIAGIAGQLAGIVIGKCTDCEPGPGFGSLTLEEVYQEQIAPLGIPAFAGAMVGHIENKFTLPVGIEAEIDATSGKIAMKEPAVV